jgi:hypothetical protein
MKSKTINGNLQVYSVWVHGREYGLKNEFAFEITEWTNNFKSALDKYFNTEIKDSDLEGGYYTEIYKDCHIILFSIDINVKEFEKKFGIKFDMNNEDCIECIPYYCNYDFNTVSERITKFK